MQLPQQLPTQQQTIADTQKRRHPWTYPEDMKLQNLVLQLGCRWKKIATYFPDRNGKSCRYRWMDHVLPRLFAPDVNRRVWSDDEDRVLITFLERGIFRWSRIQPFLRGRPSIAIRNHYYSLLRRAERIKSKLKSNPSLYSADTPLVVTSRLFLYFLQKEGIFGRVHMEIPENIRDAIDGVTGLMALGSGSPTLEQAIAEMVLVEQSSTHVPTHAMVAARSLVLPTLPIPTAGHPIPRPGLQLPTVNLPQPIPVQPQPQLQPNSPFPFYFPFGPQGRCVTGKDVCLLNNSNEHNSTDEGLDNYSCCD